MRELIQVSASYSVSSFFRSPSSLNKQWTMGIVGGGGVVVKRVRRRTAIERSSKCPPDKRLCPLNCNFCFSLLPVSTILCGCALSVQPKAAKEVKVPVGK